MKADIEKIKINYQGKEVTAHKLTVSSDIPMDINTAWEKVQTSALFEFITKGKLTFQPLDGEFPEVWKQGSTVKTSMYAYGFIPLVVIHTLMFETIDGKNKVIQSKEWDDFAKVWNHRISMRKLSDQSIHYEDEIIIYGGMLTGLISWWAKSFYKHRQRRWQLIAMLYS